MKTMTTKTTTTQISIPKELPALEKSIYLARYIGTAMDILRPLVYRVFAEKLWEGQFSSFSEYVESPEGLNLHQSYGSKLKTTHQHYIVEGGATEEDIKGIALESLYLASKTEGTIEEQIARARTLSRDELKQDRAEKDNHPFEENPNCKVCGLSRQSHP